MTQHGVDGGLESSTLLLRWTMLFRGLVVFVLAGHVFVMYCMARELRGGFGLDAPTLVISALFAGAMLIPLLWVVWLADLPEALTLRRARRRFARYECPSCAYTISGIDSASCPECGAALREPPGYTWSWRMLRRFGYMNLIAWIIGTGAGEAWMSYDEMTFRQEAAAMEQRHAPEPILLSRQRRSLGGDSILRYETTEGFTSVP